MPPPLDPDLEEPEIIERRLTSGEDVRIFYDPYLSFCDGYLMILTGHIEDKDFRINLAYDGRVASAIYGDYLLDKEEGERLLSVLLARLGFSFD